MNRSKYQVMRLMAVLLCIGISIPIVMTVAFAAAPRATTIMQFEATCSSVTFAYLSDASHGYDDAAIRITNLTTSEVLFNVPHGSSPYSPWEGGDTIEFDTQPNNSEIELYIEAGAKSWAWALCKGGTTVTPTPEEPEPSIPADGRFCYGPGAAPVALYGNGGGIDIYQIDADDEGSLILSKSAEALDALPADASVNLAGGNSGKIGFYKLGDDLFQVNVGPLSDGKVHSCVFDSIPDYDAVLTSYNVYGQ
jgi:hypothetical protein